MLVFGGWIVDVRVQNLYVPGRGRGRFEAQNHGFLGMKGRQMVSGVQPGHCRVDTDPTLQRLYLAGGALVPCRGVERPK